MSLNEQNKVVFIYMCVFGTSPLSKMQFSPRELPEMKKINKVKAILIYLMEYANRIEQNIKEWRIRLGFRVPVIYLYCNICILLEFDSQK